jgi:cholest-4-en-3-one 26-monooxygenase
MINSSSSGCPVAHGHRTVRPAFPARPYPPGAPAQIEGIDLADPDTYVPSVPHEMYRRLRAEAPVYWHPEVDATGFWAITRYEDVVRVSRDHRTFSSGVAGCFLFDNEPEDLSQIQLMMVNMDPPRHTKLRMLVNKGFTPRVMTALEPHVREICRRIVDSATAGGEGDFVTRVAAELPLQVIAEFVGVPLEDRKMLFEWSNRLIGFDDPEFNTSLEDSKLAAMEMYAYTNQLALERRDNPRDDIVSILMNAEVDGERLTELEFDLFVLLLAVAGNETTRNLISGGLLTLMQHPGTWETLRGDHSLLPSAIEEMLRFVSPLMHFRRTATHDVELRGQKIREGDKVVMWYPSANRDETVFPDADRFDIRRTPNDHLSFGLGQHFCLGANLARLEVRIMFEELLSRWKTVEPAGNVRRLRSNFINGIKEMPVRFTT